MQSTMSEEFQYEFGKTANEEAVEGATGRSTADICRHCLVITQRSMASLFASFSRLLLEALFGRRLASVLAGRIKWFPIDQSDKSTEDTNMNANESDNDQGPIKINKEGHFCSEQQADIYTTTPDSDWKAEGDTKMTTSAALEQQQVVESRGAEPSDQLLWEALDKVREQSLDRSGQVHELRPHSQADWSTETTMSDTQSLEPPASSTSPQSQPAAFNSSSSNEEDTEATRQQSEAVSGSETHPELARRDWQDAAVEAAVEAAAGDLDRDRSLDNERRDQQQSERQELQLRESSIRDEPETRPEREDTVEDTMRIDARGDSIATEDSPVSEQQVEPQVPNEGQIEAVGGEQADDAQERQPHLAGLGHHQAADAEPQQDRHQQRAESLPDARGEAQSDLADQHQEQQVVELASADTWSGSSSVELAEDSGELEAVEEEEEDFCGESASSSTLRRLKLCTFEDVLVCGQNRDSMDAARRLFDSLVRQQQQPERIPTGGRASAPPTQHVRPAGSLHSSEPEDDSEVSGSANGSSSGTEENEQQLYDIKIVRRSGSSASNSNSFRQTLVCSLSPTSQLGDSGSDLASSPDAQYPIDGDEIKQCREAFRENKRLIEEQQERATKHLGRCQSSASCRNDSGPNQRAANQWSKFNREYLEQQSQSKCSHCDQRLYPIDRMELDFTRATLNIHRNCFKCQVCSTLLRLETYAALDAKLYCPAHIKRVTPSR